MTVEEATRRMKVDDERRRRRIVRTYRALVRGRLRDGALLIRETQRREQVWFFSPTIGGGWRATRFVAKEPVGHREFRSFKEAALSFAGKWGKWGPPDGQPDQWTVLGEADRF